MIKRNLADPKCFNGSVDLWTWVTMVN